MVSKRLKIYSFWSVVAILLVFLLSTSFITRISEKDVHLADVCRRNFEIRINTIGVLDAARSYRVSSEIKGNKGKIIYLVEDGSWVEKDSVLVRFDPSPFEAEVLSLSGEVESQAAVVEAAEQALEWEKTQVERELKVAEFELKTAHLELTAMVDGEIPLQQAQLESELEEARQNYQKYENFLSELEKLEKNVISNTTEIKQARNKILQLRKLFEIAHKKYTCFNDYVVPSKIENAKTRVYRAQMELAQMKKGSVFKVARAAAAVEKARRELETAEEKLIQVQRELEKTVVRAPFPGIAILYESYRDNEKRKPRIGDPVWQNQPILYLPDVSSFIVKTKIREVDLHKVHRDQTATIQIDAYPSITFKGTILSIGALAEKSEGLGREKYFQLKVLLEGQDTALRPGMTARISILGQKITDALSIPIQSIFSDGESKFCYKYTGHTYVKIPVEITAQNDDFVEIKSGLKVGDRVSLIKPEYL
jgi:HlyD family secretion protein